MREEDLLLWLREPKRIYSRAEVLARPSPVPRAPGVYGWFFRAIPNRVPLAGCLRSDKLTLLYVGIAPKKPTVHGANSHQTLRSRLRQHYCLNAEGSTLRLTLGCLLAPTLGLELRRVGSGKRLTFGKAGEGALSEWMAANAFVTWIECPAPWVIEDHAIKTVQLPLNLHGNGHHPFCQTLSEIRATNRALARAKPIAAS